MQQKISFLLQVLPLKKFQVKDINEISRKFCAQHLQKSLGACRVIKVSCRRSERQLIVQNF